jgi:predicted ATPase
VLGQAWIVAAGYAVPQVEAAFTRARDLCEEAGDAKHLFFVLLGLWQFYIARQELALASDAADRLLALALGQQNRDFAIEAHVAQIVTAYTQGDFEKTLAHANEAIGPVDPEKPPHGHIQTFGYDGHVLVLIGASWALWTLGYPDRALERMQEALARAQKLAHPYSQSMVLLYSAWLHMFRREASAAREHAGQGIALSLEHGFPWPQAYATAVHGWALAEEGCADEGMKEIREGLAALEQMGHGLWRPHRQGLLAAAFARAGQTEEALAVVTQALEDARRTGDLEHAAELHRQRGELTLRHAAVGAALAAEKCFGQAIGTARGQKAKSWELRAAISLARLWGDQGRRRQARELLAPVCDWFTEGFDTPDLQDANALLEALT